MLTTQDKTKLTPFFSNLDKNVFVLLNMPEILKGALFSRYSRSSKSLRELFLNEYLQSGELKLKEKDFSQISKVGSILSTDRAEKFFSKWLAEYGDDSIAELGGVHLAIENVSVLATKFMEDRRIGLSPLEKSTRYVRFDDKVRGKYKYYRDKEILKSKHADAYIKAMALLFDTYSELIEPMKNYFKTRYPKPESVSDKAYEMSIRAKACDTLRGLLPLSTLTNMGIFGNGRAYEYMLTKMFAADLNEVNSIANSAFTELSKVIFNFIERIKTEKGKNYINYLKTTSVVGAKLSGSFNESAKFAKKSVKIVDYDKDAENKLLACIVFPNSNLPLEKLMSKVAKLSSKKKIELLKSYYENRLGRWHKIGRAFEDPYYHFEIVSDFGAYKDLERHRIMTQEKQTLTCDLGYEVPDEIVEAGFEKKYVKAMDSTKKVYEKLRTKLPAQAQYAVTHGFNVRYRMKMNLREAFHLCELRSQPAGHPAYRFIAQEIYKRIKEVHPNLGDAMKFVNMETVGLERLSSEIRKEQKMQKFV